MKAIQKNLTIIIWVCNIAVLLMGFIAGYEDRVKLYMSCMLMGVGIAATILYFVPMKERIKAIIVLLMTGTSTLGISILLGGNGGTFISSFLVLAGALLYFDPIILAAYSVVYLLLCIGVFAYNPVLVIGRSLKTSMGVVMMIVYAFMTVCLYIGTKLGNKYIQLADSDRKDAQEKSEIVAEQTESAQQNSELIYQKIEKSRHTVSDFSKEAYEATQNVQYLKNAESKTLELFHGFKEDIETTTEWIGENHELITLLQNNHMTAMESVEESKQYSDSAKESMNEIATAIQHAYECIEESSRETDKIAAIIQNMNEISTQTNLLALNASIEAARVSDEGNGFEIVAEQIRTLSVQSKQSEENISRIVSVLSEALASTNEKVSKGNEAIQRGMSNLEHMVDGINRIDHYSKESQETLSHEVAMFEAIKQEFGKMVTQVEDSMETVKREMTELEVVVDAIASQTNKTEQVSEYLHGMEQVADHLTAQFTS